MKLIDLGIRLIVLGIRNLEQKPASEESIRHAVEVAKVWFEYGIPVSYQEELNLVYNAINEVERARWQKAHPPAKPKRVRRTTVPPQSPQADGD